MAGVALASETPRDQQGALPRCSESRAVMKFSWAFGGHHLDMSLGVDSFPWQGSKRENTEFAKGFPISVSLLHGSQTDTSKQIAGKCATSTCRNVSFQQTLVVGSPKGPTKRNLPIYNKLG